MKRCLGLCFVAVAMLTSVTALQAAPIFYLSDLPLGAAAPGVLDRAVAPGATGQIGIFATADVRLSGISLNLAAAGGGIQFTGATVANPDSRWTFTEVPVVGAGQVSSIGGGAIPFVSGTGIGPAGGAIDAVSGYLIGTVDYTAQGSGSSDLFLSVGANTIADWDGNNVPVIFGPGSPETNGGVVGATDVMFDGRITVLGGATPPVVGDLGPLVADMSANPPHTPTVISEILPFTYDGSDALVWSLDSFDGPGGLKTPDFDTATGLFTWDADGSQGGLYTAVISALGEGGTDSGMLTINVIVPEPASIALLGLALVGFAGFRRK